MTCTLVACLLFVVHQLEERYQHEQLRAEVPSVCIYEDPPTVDPEANVP